MGNSFPSFKCPYCFKELKYNNVVFRRDSRSEGDDDADYYLKAYYDKMLKHYDVMDYPYYDIADCHISDIHLNDEKKIDRVNNPDKSRISNLTERLCPYCHNKLFSGLGSENVKYIAVIGAPASGKTTLLASMHKNLRDMRPGESYSWAPMVKGDDLNDIAIKLQAGDSNARLATDKVNGPYYYRFSVTPSLAGAVQKKYSEKTDIIFFDVPGEFFTTPDKIATDLHDYLSNADGILFVVNSAEALNGTVVLDSGALQVLNAFVMSGIPRRQNVAIVLNKLDLIGNEIGTGLKGIDEYIPPQVLASIDLQEIDSYSETIRQMMLGQNAGNHTPTQQFLQSIVNLINTEFPRKTRLFATSLLRENEYNNSFIHTAQNCEVPLLWLLSQISSFPIKKKTK